MALDISELRAEYGRLLPGWLPEDVAGSAYAIHDYKLDPYLGGARDLPRLKDTINRAGLKLILDFVPNHVALDHRWTLLHPDYLVRPTPTARRNHPEWFFKPARGVFLAHGRDPYFAPWTDTAQINVFSPEARKAMRQILERIAFVSDGVRCDMAMLTVTDIFKKTWGDCVSAPPGKGTEFWEDLLAPIKKSYPGFWAMAESYWGMGDKLLSLGFDAVYDKAFYDYLREGDAGRVREHLHDSELNQRAQVRFVENHDEPRVAAAFGRERGLAAQAVTFTVPGCKLFHQDQERGMTHRVPVQMRRFLRERQDPHFEEATARLLDFVKHPAMKDGHWRQLAAHEAWPGSTAQNSVLGWIWTRGHDLALVAVNYGPDRGVARLRLPEGLFHASTVRLKDWAGGAIYERASEELTGEGLYIELEAWQYHLFTQA